jgi:hypothetical protein
VTSIVDGLRGAPLSWWALVGGLVVVAILHTIGRMRGGMAALFLCVAALVYAIEHDVGSFPLLGQQVPSIVQRVAFASLLVFYVVVVFRRGFSRWRRARQLRRKPLL